MTEGLVRFAGEQLKTLGLQTIWRNPKRNNTDPADIMQMTQFVNLKIKLEFAGRMDYSD